MNQPKKDMLQTFDADSLASLSGLLRDHRQAVLATLNPETGSPYTAMVAFVPEPDFGAMLLHLSGLSAHKRYLLEQPRCSLIVFQPDNGKTEILQHHRVALDCVAQRIARDAAAYEAAKQIYLDRFPGHSMMFGLGDFDLLRLEPLGGLMNAGFGRAFAVRTEDLANAARGAGQAD